MFIAYATVETASTYQRSRGAVGLVGLSVIDERSCERCAEHYTIESTVGGVRPAQVLALEAMQIARLPCPANLVESKRYILMMENRGLIGRARRNE